MWLARNDEEITVVRCTIERLMTELCLAGATRCKAKRTTVADPIAPWQNQAVLMGANQVDIVTDCGGTIRSHAKSRE